MTDPETIKQLSPREVKKWYGVETVEEALAKDDGSEGCDRCGSSAPPDQWYRVEFSNIDRTEMERYYLCLACKTIFRTWLHKELEK